MYGASARAHGFRVIHANHRIDCFDICVIQILNDKFSGEIEVREASAFPDQYFTCTVRCVCCSARCSHSMNHSLQGEPHFAASLCKYVAERDNKVYICKVSGACPRLAVRSVATSDAQVDLALIHVALGASKDVLICILSQLSISLCL